MNSENFNEEPDFFPTKLLAFFLFFFLFFPCLTDFSKIDCKIWLDFRYRKKKILLHKKNFFLKVAEIF